MQGEREQANTRSQNGRVLEFSLYELIFLFVWPHDPQSKTLYTHVFMHVVVCLFAFLRVCLFVHICVYVNVFVYVHT